MKVLVYQMGKVASATIHRSLLAHGGVDVEHVHEVDPGYVRDVRCAAPESTEYERCARLRALMQSDAPLSVITLAREPVARNVSLLWENHGAEIAAHPELERSLWDALPHNEVLTWFDREFKQTLGMNVYEHPMNWGWSYWCDGAKRVLVMKCELGDWYKQQLISMLLGLSGFILRRHNVNDSQEYAEFKKHFRVPPAYADMMASAKYTRHFYTADEIKAMRERWTER